MSSQAVAWAIVHQAGGPSAKAVLLSIANYADAYGECWQDQKTLAEGAEIKERQFRTILAGLIGRGLVERVRRGGKGGGRLPDLLRLRMRELPAILTAKRREEVSENNAPEQPATGQSGRKQPAISSNRQSLPKAEQPAKIAERATGNPAYRNRQIVAGSYKDNPTIPTTPCSPPGFEEAWKLWPKHHRASSKAESLRRWRAIGADPDRMLQAIRLYLASPDATKVTPDGVRGGFVKAFEAWLNKQAECWLEQINPVPDFEAALGIWRASNFKFWDRDKYGPAPNEPGYRGPPVETDLFTQERAHEA